MHRAKNLWPIFLGMMTSVATAQSDPTGNVFFGFEFFLQPITIKWACGEPRDQDMAALEALMVAFPKDARRADLQTAIDAFVEMADGEGSLAKIFGGELKGAEIERLCGAARPLSLVWATPEQMVAGDETLIPSAQRTAWSNFWRVVESLH